MATLSATIQPPVRRRAPSVRRLLPFLAWVAFFILWQIVGSILPPSFLSTPTAVASASWFLIQNGTIQAAAVMSIRLLIVGFAVATVLGIMIGLLMGRSRLADHALEWIVTALYVTPSIALIPVITLWFGLDFEAKITIIFLSSVFPIILNTRQGAKDLSASYEEIGRAFVLPWHQRLTKITMWAIFPYIVAGARLSIGRAIATMLVAEMVTRAQGLGQLLLTFQGTLRTDRLWVPILILLILGIGLNQLFLYIETRVAPWRAASQA